MDKDKFLNIVKEFLKCNVLSKAGDWNQWAGTFALSFIKRGVSVWFDEHSDKLKRLGVMTAEGMIDVDILEEALEDAFNAQPSIKVDFEEIVPMLPMVSTFTKADADKLMLMLREQKAA